MKSQVGGGRAWGPMEVAKLGLFCVWWPCKCAPACSLPSHMVIITSYTEAAHSSSHTALYALYTYMLKQRKKVLGKGKGRVLGGKKTN